jgi:hypothetical protein
MTIVTATTTMSDTEWILEGIAGLLLLIFLLLLFMVMSEAGRPRKRRE